MENLKTGLSDATICLCPRKADKHTDQSDQILWQSVNMLQVNQACILISDNKREKDLKIVSQKNWLTQKHTGY